MTMDKTRGADVNLEQIWYNFPIVCAREARVRKLMPYEGNNKGTGRYREYARGET